MRLWRISRFRDRAKTFDGEGARQFPGRWNPPGVSVVYTSSSLSLAILEILVHAEKHHLKGPYYKFAVEVPDKLVEELSERDLPADWRNITNPRATQAIGGAWASSLRSVALLVPSIVTPEEQNAILNPRHPAFRRLKIGRPLPFSFDVRLKGARPAKPRRRRAR